MPGSADDTEQNSTPTRSAPRYAPSPTTGRSAAARGQSTSTMAAASAGVLGQVESLLAEPYNGAAGRRSAR